VPESIGEGVYEVICKSAMDAQEQIMREADVNFRFARQLEKAGKYESAREWYRIALSLAPNNGKILLALQRVEEKPR
jgi:tetratricopeptide (TPR) repeat protein